MIEGGRVVAVVPARGGSKTIPDKNLRELGGKPLVAWPVEVAGATEAVDRTLLTTDSDDIADAAREYGAEVVDRPADLAGDDALVIDALRHVREQLRAEDDTPTYMVMLEPTCPFRTAGDVTECLELLARGPYDSVATFTRAAVNPHRTWRIDDGRPEQMVPGTDPWLPRQQLPEAYELNGGVYAFALDALPSEGHTLLFGTAGAVTMPPERSVDVDTPLDLELARTVLEELDLPGTTE
jgi:CMP-N,N'-diacetyllegionaminic acid synthase